MQTRLSATSPADLLALVPYLFGFKPEESIVLMASDGQTPTGVARIDLADAEEQPALITHSWLSLARSGSLSRVYVLGFGAEPARLVAALREATETIEREAGSPLVACVAFTDGLQWWTLADDWLWDPRSGLAYDPMPPIVVEAAVTGGLSVRGSRADLESAVRCATADEGRAFAKLVGKARKRLRGHTAQRRRDRTLQLLFEALPTPAGLSEADQAELVALAQDIDTRDEIWLTQSRANADQHQVLWHHLLLRTPGPLARPILGLLGFAAWLNGDGAVANVACERGLDLDRGYRMAQLLSDALMSGAHPDLWSDMSGVR